MSPDTDGHSQQVDQDRYETLDVIGTGGMATVWRARDTYLDRFVGIKRPHPAPEGSIEAELFAREARAAASVMHPNVVAVYDTGTDETGPYLVMELVDGPSLAEVTVPHDQVARIGLEVASGLAALHRAGVVHGDVKPANILLSQEGAKLTDFGIARAADGTEALTRPGTAFGTPAYAAPETATHGERTAAGDVYSLAVTLHELLTGSRWNASAGATQAMPPSEWARALAPALSTDPAERPTVDEMAATLAVLGAPDDAATTTVPMLTAAGGEGITVTGDGGSTARRRVAIGAALGAAVIIVALTLAMRDRSITSADRAGVTASNDATESIAPAASSTTLPTTTIATTTPTTAPAATLPPTRSASAIATDIVALIEAVPREELKPKDANDLVERVEDVVRTADREPRETEKKLREAAEHIAKQVDDNATLDAAELLLVELAESLQVSPETVAAALDRRD